MLVRILRALSDRSPVAIAVVCADIPELLAELGRTPRISVRIGYGSGRSLAAKLWAVVATFRALMSTRGRLVLFAPGSVHVGRQHVLLAKLTGRRVVVYVPLCFAGAAMGLRHPALADWLTRRVAGIVDLWITITRAQQELLTGYYGICRPVQVVPNVASAAEPAAMAAATRKDERLQVVFLGRYEVFHKGLDWLCRALQESRARWTGRICFQFFGAGGYRSELERLASACAPGEITVNGWTESATALAGADLLLVPSRFEGFPLVFIEAARAGVPILSTTFPGAGELLGEGAWLEVGDADRLVLALLRMTDGTLRRTVAGIQKASLEAQSLPRTFDLAIAALAQRLQ